MNTVDSSVASLGEIGGLDDRALPRLIAERLAHSIVDGRLAPGQRLAEVEIAELFGTSRTPVREAFQLLTHEGLIELIPRRGARVVQLGPEDVHGAYVCRAAVMGLANRLSALRMKASGHRRLDRLCEDMEDHLADQELPAFFDSCVDFGDTLLEAAGIQQLIQLARSLRGASAFALDTVSAQAERATAVLAHYRAVAAAVRDGDPDAAEQAMRAVQGDFGDWLVATQFGDMTSTLPPITELVLSSAR